MIYINCIKRCIRTCSCAFGAAAPSSSQAAAAAQVDDSERRVWWGMVGRVGHAACSSGQVGIVEAGEHACVHALRRQSRCNLVMRGR